MNKPFSSRLSTNKKQSKTKTHNGSISFLPHVICMRLRKYTHDDFFKLFSLSTPHSSLYCNLNKSLALRLMFFKYQQLLINLFAKQGDLP